ncbi:HdeD family acid-resistance protein [Roseomonas sp. WA12]
MSATTIPTPTEGRFRVIRALAGGWWLLLLRGIVSVLFGLYAFLVPGLGLAVILGVLAAWLALDGIFTLTQAFTGRSAMPGSARPHTGWLWLDGLLSLVAAVVLLMMPVASAIVLVLLVAAWSIATGVFRIVLAYRSGSWLMGLWGALGVAIGLWMVAAPGAGLLALIWVVAIQAVVGGVLLVSLAFRLRRVHYDPTPG